MTIDGAGTLETVQNRLVKLHIVLESVGELVEDDVSHPLLIQDLQCAAQTVISYWPLLVHGDLFGAHIEDHHGQVRSGCDVRGHLSNTVIFAASLGYVLCVPEGTVSDGFEITTDPREIICVKDDCGDPVVAEPAVGQGAVGLIHEGNEVSPCGVAVKEDVIP